MPLRKLILKPACWPTLLQMFCLRVLICLPWRLQYALGRGLGRLLHILLRKRRHIVDTNLRLCFPELSTQEREQYNREIFQNNAIGFLETAMSWWGNPGRFQGRYTLVGTEHIEQAHAEGKGVLLVGAHYSTLDLGGYLTGQELPINIVYRPHNNPAVDYFLQRGRRRWVEGMIDNRNLRNVVKALKDGKIVWVAPDQDMGPENSIYAPFFGIDAATVPSISRLARLSKAKVMMFAQYRLPGNQGYELRIGPALENFPSKDEQADTSRINSELEQLIREFPTQYMWVHRRFKTHPKGKNFLYHRRKS